MNPCPRLATIGSIGIFIVTLLTLTFLGACQNGLDKDDVDRHAQGKKGPSPISVENGRVARL
jgi:hypothetical protein